MSAVREELHHLVDQLPDDEVSQVLTMLRFGGSSPGPRLRALASLEHVQERMRGVTGIDEEIDQLRDLGG